MAERYELKTARTGTDGKTYWTKIGVMFPNKSGKDSFNLIFEALPIPAMNDSGQLEVRVMAMEPCLQALRNWTTKPHSRTVNYAAKL